MYLRPEYISGIMIVFSKDLNSGKIIAGFEKRPHIISAPNKKIAIDRIKEILSGLDPIVLESYRRNPKVMRELEDL